MTIARTAAVGAMAVAISVMLLAACSGSSGDAGESPATVASGSAPSDNDTSRPALPPPNAEAADSAAVNQALVGLTEEEAQSAAAAAGYTVRIASVDGEPRALTMDYRFDRINLELESGTVTGATVG